MAENDPINHEQLMQIAETYQKTIQGVPVDVNILKNYGDRKYAFGDYDAVVEVSAMGKDGKPVLLQTRIPENELAKQCDIDHDGNVTVKEYIDFAQQSKLMTLTGQVRERLRVDYDSHPENFEPADAAGVIKVDYAKLPIDYFNVAATADHAQKTMQLADIAKSLGANNVYTLSNKELVVVATTKPPEFDTKKNGSDFKVLETRIPAEVVTKLLDTDGDGKLTVGERLNNNAWQKLRTLTTNLEAQLKAHYEEKPEDFKEATVEESQTTYKPTDYKFDRAINKIDYSVLTK